MGFSALVARAPRSSRQAKAATRQAVGREADAWDQEQLARTSLEDRLRIAELLRRRAYGEHAADVRESERQSCEATIFPLTFRSWSRRRKRGQTTFPNPCRQSASRPSEKSSDPFLWSRKKRGAGAARLPLSGLTCRSADRPISSSSALAPARPVRCGDPRASSRAAVRWWSRSPARRAGSGTPVAPRGCCLAASA